MSQAAKRGESTDGVAFLERYGENFDPRLGFGDIEIWVPIVSIKE